MTEDFLHGGALDHMRQAFPDAPDPWIDLSTGINPWHYPITEVPVSVLHHLPKQAAYENCRQAMAQAFGTASENILISPGSELLIRLLPDIISPERVAILSPTYGDHARAWKAATCEVIETDDPLAMADEVDAVVLCNPNNPDGQYFGSDAMISAAKKLQSRGGWLIVDEAYADIEPARSIASHIGQHNLIILRSFGKFFGLAGVRLGCLIASPLICSLMSERLGVWPVSGPALDIGARAYADLDWQNQTRTLLKAASARLDSILKASNLPVTGSCNLFRLVQTPDAERVWRQLARKGIYVRRFDWSDRMIRIGLPGSPDGEQRLAKALTL